MPNIMPQDWIRRTYGYGAYKLSKLFGLRYIGDEESGLMTVGSTDNDLLFEHGDLGTEAADTTVYTTGTVNLSDSSGLTLFEVYTAVNASPNWEIWMIDFKPSTPMEVSGGNGIILAAGIAVQQCKTDAGIIIVQDTTLLATPELVPVGVTFNGPSSGPHNKDANVLHEILGITVDCNCTTADGVHILECDDVLGTETEIDVLTYVDDTLKVFENSGEPLYQSTGKRLVVEVRDTNAITDALLRVSARSYPFGPAVRENKLISNY